MTDKQRAVDSSTPQFRSRRERREYERALASSQGAVSTTELSDQNTELSQTEPDTVGSEHLEVPDGSRPKPVAADGPGGLEYVPTRPTDYLGATSVQEPEPELRYEVINHDRDDGELPRLPQDARNYPDIDVPPTLDEEAEDKPLGYMLVADGQDVLPEIDEDEMAQRQSRKRRRTIIMLTSFAAFLGLLAVVGIGLGQLIGWTNKDFPGPGGAEVAFEVHPGEGPIVIGNRLVEDNIVASTRAFRDAVEATNTTAQIQPGEYMLRYEMPARDAAEILLRVGVPGMNYAHVNSGYRINDVFEALEERTDYSAEEIEEAADPANFDIPAEATTLEGYVAVGEYHFPFDASLQEIFETMIAPTLEEFERLEITDEAEQHRLVTVASIIEAEARPKDFGIVAGIIENRLDSSNPETRGLLQIDATVIYGMGVRQLQFSADDRTDASNEYNTYVHKGLPPGPIGAPSIAALDAAAEPEDTDYYYWITTNIETGETKFSTTLQQHQEYHEQYRQYCAENEEICGTN